MEGWYGALFDSCSLITQAGSGCPGAVRTVPPWPRRYHGALEMDRVYPETIARLAPRIRLVESASAAVLAEVLENVQVPLGLSGVDRIILATAIHYRMPVVTADKKMALTMRMVGGQVWNMAMILQEFVLESLISPAEVERILLELACQNELLIQGGETTWVALAAYQFPPG